MNDRGRGRDGNSLPPSRLQIPFCRGTLHHQGNHHPGPRCVARWSCRRAEGGGRGEGRGTTPGGSRIWEVVAVAGQCPTATRRREGEGEEEREGRMEEEGRRRKRERCASGGVTKARRSAEQRGSWDDLRNGAPTPRTSGVKGHRCPMRCLD